MQAFKNFEQKYFSNLMCTILYICYFKKKNLTFLLYNYIFNSNLINYLDL